MFTVPKISLFQFHKGTIKTTSSGVRFPRCCDFNSIKVQLRLYEVDSYAFPYVISIP